MSTGRPTKVPSVKSLTPSRPSVDATVIIATDPATMSNAAALRRPRAQATKPAAAVSRNPSASAMITGSSSQAQQPPRYSSTVRLLVAVLATQYWHNPFREVARMGPLCKPHSATAGPSGSRCGSIGPNA